MIIPLLRGCYVKSYHEQAADAGSQLFVHGGMFDSCLCMGVCISDQSSPLLCHPATTKRILTLRYGKRGVRWSQIEDKE